MFDAPTAVATPDAVNAFIERWQNTTGTEKANYQLFLSELCVLLTLPTPDPASKDNKENAYTFERRVDIQNPDGSENRGFIDLYKRGVFVLEAKQTGKGLVSTLLADHDALDKAVFNAYGWDDVADKLVGLPGATTPLPDKPATQTEAEEELLMRLVALNKQRAAEEAQGKVRWLRPDYQAPKEAAPTQNELQSTTADVSTSAVDKTKATWPKDLATQVTLLRDMLAASPHSAENLAAQFKRKPQKGVNEVLSALAALGQAQEEGQQWRLVR
ncbi:type IIL restriction-modification enzyme MmeI [Halomonas sp. AOP22-C1-8]|uniref:type IIL restriction-modification enzyme MmeI n=1 Tax=Halomonas sp. AOP22-C1-8 TaxID=3457717 RepID=UPI0040336ED6